MVERNANLDVVVAGAAAAAARAVGLRRACRRSSVGGQGARVQNEFYRDQVSWKSSRAI